jgi:hypothetical protein
MTSTVVINAQDVGVAANEFGMDLFPQKVTLDSATTAFALSLKLVSPATGWRVKSHPIRVTLHYVSSPEDVTASAAMAMLKQAASSVELYPREGASAQVAINTPLVPAVGGFVYFWLDVPEYNAELDLSVTITEL